MNNNTDLILPALLLTVLSVVLSVATTLLILDRAFSNATVQPITVEPPTVVYEHPPAPLPPSPLPLPTF